MEAPPGIGPGIKVLQTSALPLGYGAILNSRDKEEITDTAFAVSVTIGADYGVRTRYLHLGKVALYQMS